MGIEEAIKQAFMEKGEKKGEYQKAYFAVRNMLIRNFPDKDIREIQGVDQAFIDKVKSDLAKEK